MLGLNVYNLIWARNFSARSSSHPKVGLGTFPSMSAGLRNLDSYDDWLLVSLLMDQSTGSQLRGMRGGAARHTSSVQVVHDSNPCRTVGNQTWTLEMAPELLRVKLLLLMIICEHRKKRPGLTWSAPKAGSTLEQPVEPERNAQSHPGARIKSVSRKWRERSADE